MGPTLESGRRLFDSPKANQENDFMKRMLCVLATVVSMPALAEEVTLNGLSAFAIGTTFSRPFEAFVDWVNEHGQGTIQIELLGGPEAIPPFELGNAVASGIVDVANVTSAYYTTLIPVAEALHLATNTVQDQRQNGCFDTIDAIHQEQMNAKYLARTGDHVAFHLYLTKPIDEPDLTGLTIRTTPVYRAMFEALGATLVNTAPGEVYSALERNAIDGYGWPIQGILDLGWDEQTRYRVDPGFYQADVNILVNLETWNALGAEQKAVLESAAAWVEEQNSTNLVINETEAQRQADAGIQVIEFDGAGTEHWLQTAQAAGWAAVAELDGALAEILKRCLDPSSE